MELYIFIAGSAYKNGVSVGKWIVVTASLGIYKAYLISYTYIACVGRSVAIHLYGNYVCVCTAEHEFIKIITNSISMHIIFCLYILFSW